MTRGGRAVLLAALLAGVSCMPLDEVAVAPEPAGQEPTVRVMLLQDASRPTFASDGGIHILDPDEGDVADVPPGIEIGAAARGDLVMLTGMERGVSRRLVLLAPADPDQPIRVGRRSYRGVIELTRDADGVQVINRVGLEGYLAGVVPAEMGRRAPGEEAALRAQAIASRTYALRRMRAAQDQPWDVDATVNSQVYPGTALEYPLATEAVLATRGEILTWQGEPIEAFFSSTCGGHSEAAGDVFVGGDRPYLPSQPDLAPDGTPWCAISPRYRWHEQWTRSQLAGILRRTLAAERLATARASDLREARVLDRTRSGRIGTLELVGAGGRTAVRGSAIRRVLETTAGGILWSADFTIRISRQGGRIERIDADGRGNGHGVGMCQWGAIGRSRAGQDHQTILMSYFPGTDLETAY